MDARSTSNRPDVYTTITRWIVRPLETGGNLGPSLECRPCGRSCVAPPAHRAKPIHQHFILRCFALNAPAPDLMTFQQALSLGAHVRKGETSRLWSMPVPHPHRDRSATGGKPLQHASSNPTASSMSIRSRACQRTITPRQNREALP